MAFLPPRRRSSRPDRRAGALTRSSTRQRPRRLTTRTRDSRAAAGATTGAATGTAGTVTRAVAGGDVSPRASVAT